MSNNHHLNISSFSRESKYHPIIRQQKYVCDFDEFNEAKKRLDDLVGLEQVDMNVDLSPSQTQKKKIFLPS